MIINDYSMMEKKNEEEGNKRSYELGVRHNNNEGQTNN